MTGNKRKRVAVLISGRGSNLAALMTAAEDPAYPAAIVGVVSNRSDAPGLDLAQAHGVATRTIQACDFSGRRAHDAAIDAALKEMDADIVCLAGYMRILSADFVKRWQGRMINIHPALLPSFRGLDTHARALEAGVRIHGCTVHFVTAEMDEGPVIAQAAVPVMTGDDEAGLTARVLAAEHRLYPHALALLARDQVHMEETGSVHADPAIGTQDAIIVSPPDDGR